MRLAFIAALVAPLALLGQNPPGLTAVLSAPGGQTTFHQGEAIHLTLSLASTVPHKYWYSHTGPQRICGWDQFAFKVTSSQGWRDPLKAFCGRGGALDILSSEDWLQPQPVILDLPLHEWVRFNQPGEYAVVVAPKNVYDSPKLGDIFNGQTALVSNPLRLTIVPSDAAWQTATLLQAAAMLQSTAGLQWDAPPRDQAAVIRAIEMLGALGTPAAARELAQWAGSGAVQYAWEQAMAETDQLEAGVAALQALSADPNHAVTAEFLQGTTELLPLARGSPGPRYDPPAQSEMLAGFYAALPAKQGPALTLSLVAAASFSPDDVPVTLRPWLTQALADHFEQLSEPEREQLFSWQSTGGTPFAGPAAIPLLRQAAAQISSKSNPWAWAAALRRWYALAPDDARPSVIAAITSTPPAGGADQLGFLSDATLPEADQPLLDQLGTVGDSANAGNSISLIARYASPAIAGAVAATLDQHRDWRCNTDLLGYLLRADASLARPRIISALAVNDPNSCGGANILEEIAKVQNDPWLQSLAVAHLDDADLNSASAAARYLGRFGDARAEGPLLHRFQMFGQELNSPEENNEQATLWNALTAGAGWLTTPSEIAQLGTLPGAAQFAAQTVRIRELWQRHPWVINQSGSNDYFTVLQYGGNLDQIEAKLAQFPAGSEFAWGGSATPEQQKIAAFLASHGMSLQINP